MKPGGKQVNQVERPLERESVNIDNFLLIIELPFKLSDTVVCRNMEFTESLFVFGDEESESTWFPAHG